MKRNEMAFKLQQAIYAYTLHQISLEEASLILGDIVDDEQHPQHHKYDHGYGIYTRNGKFLEFSHKGPHLSLPTAFTYDYLTLRLSYNAASEYPISGTIIVPAWDK